MNNSRSSVVISYLSSSWRKCKRQPRSCAAVLSLLENFWLRAQIFQFIFFSNYFACILKSFPIRNCLCDCICTGSNGWSNKCCVIALIKCWWFCRYHQQIGQHSVWTAYSPRKCNSMLKWTMALNNFNRKFPFVSLTIVRIWVCFRRGWIHFRCILFESVPQVIDSLYIEYFRIFHHFCSLFPCLSFCSHTDTVWNLICIAHSMAKAAYFFAFSLHVPLWCLLHNRGDRAKALLVCLFL